MKVDHSTSASIQQSESSASRAAERAKKIQSQSGESGSASSSGDVKAEISTRAKAMALAKDVATRAPEEREQLIAQLKDRIAKGEYNVAPENVTDRMVKKHLLTRDLG